MAASSGFEKRIERKSIQVDQRRANAQEIPHGDEYRARLRYDRFTR
jgi:hypothetical protein